MELAGRTCPRVYRVSGRTDIHQFLVDAVAASGGRVLYASDPKRTPVFLGVEGPAGDRVGLLVYPFRMTQRLIEGRPADEVRGQIRYGGEPSWEEDHPLGWDVAGVDTTLVLGVFAEGGLIVGLQAALYDPLPMGISFYAKTHQTDVARQSSWHVWERSTLAGVKRNVRRSIDGLETMVAFTPDRLLDYALLERRAADLGLDHPLRFAAAESAAARRGAADPAGSLRSLHELERQFELDSAQILEIISTRNRLQVAVRGGVAEFHLEKLLQADPTVAAVDRLDQDAQHDFDVTMVDGRTFKVECKNASPERYADGDLKVEVQKTRASKNDPASRFYGIDQFDVVAACLYSPTRAWTFRYQATSRLAVNPRFADRLAPLQRINATWVDRLAAL